ncbi:MAG: hypothetical protein GWN18_05580 [Thermoplasmata archaeon]|nr:hypothetical protein [Thermoplasmata archaeon]NIS11522.1 hypothetical protein [Thermoplasmata archaeon]NIS19440.1 hypothetical protein [Thermoplasmata archaeon]NIT76565.1 hypothetical protein [Thermoplasmata archaeon]NIU48558.1 hypothetical protein [Thermoplasmata archaeon]
MTGESDEDTGPREVDEGTGDEAPPAEGGLMAPPPSLEESPDTLVSVNVEALFPEIQRLKVSGAIMFVIAGLGALAPLLLVGGDALTEPRGLIAIVLAAGGIIVGVVGLLSPSLRGIAIFVAPVVLVAAAAAGTLGASLDTIPPLELAFAFVFAASWLLAVEHLHALGRFVELGAYVTRQRLTTFRLGGVVNHFQVYGLGLVAIISGVAAVVIVGVPWVFAKGSSGVFARSVELASVFGIALAATVVFTLSALILVFVRSVIPQRVDVERVAYSRDRMEDMLRSSRMMEPGDEERR